MYIKLMSHWNEVSSPHSIIYLCLKNFASQKQLKPSRNSTIYSFVSFLLFCTVLLYIPVKIYTTDLTQTGSSFKMYGMVTVQFNILVFEDISWYVIL